MLYGSEFWIVNKYNEMAFQWAEMRMVGWMCDNKVKVRLPSKKLRERD